MARKSTLRAVQTHASLLRPMPPADLALTGEFRPAPDVAEWLTAAFIAPDATMLNEDHAHLRHASIGVLWTNIRNARQMRVILATAEQPVFRGSKWSKARQDQQIMEWFGNIPDFLITFQAEWAEITSDIEWCAVAEHELSHCAQELDPFGLPKFRRDGRPVFAIKGHDVEEFVGVVRRYGPTSGALREMIEASQRGPEIAPSLISGACGTCRSLAA